MQDQYRGERKNSKKTTRSHQSGRFDLDEFTPKVLPRQKRKERKGWKSTKFALEHMDINDLRDYIAETEY